MRRETAAGLDSFARGDVGEVVAGRLHLSWMSIGLVAGGGLAMLGAVLPWLTLFAGLQRYGGTSGLYGRLVFAGGALAFAGGILTPWMAPRWIRRAEALLGTTLIFFALWLLVGLRDVLHRGASPMLVPKAGSGLYVVLAGACLIVASAVLSSLMSAGSKVRWRSWRRPLQSRAGSLDQKRAIASRLAQLQD